MATVALYALGIMGVMGVAFYANHANVVVRHYKNDSLPVRDPASYYVPYTYMINEPTTRWNKFLDEAQVRRVHDTTTGLPQYEVTHNGMTTFLSRMPKRL